MAKRSVVGNRLDFIEPMQPTLVDEPPEGEDWIHEVKFDGYRTQIVLKAGKAPVFTRRGHDWTDKYRPIAEAAEALPCRSAIIDGEMVVFDAVGRDFVPRAALGDQQQPPGWCSSPSICCTSTARIYATGRSSSGGGCCGS